MHLQQDDTNPLDHIDNSYRLGDLITAALRDSDYRFGQLDFAMPVDEDEAAEYGMSTNAWTYYELRVVMHPTKGSTRPGWPPLGERRPSGRNLQPSR